MMKIKDPNLRLGKLPLVPYFHGVGWDTKLAKWIEENLPDKFFADGREDYEGEARIRCNLTGCVYSSCLYRELGRAIHAYNNGEAYDTPLCEWNRKDIEARRRARL